MSATHTYIYPQTRVAGTSLLLLLLLLGPGLLPLPGAHGLLVVNNCTQQRLALPYSRVGCSDVAGGRYALLAAEGHVDDPNASSVAIFDTATGTWSTSHLSAGRSNKCTTAWGNLAIIAGGTPARGLPKSTSVDVWDADTGLWSLQHMSIGRDLLACASAGPYTIFAGGSAPQANQSETAVVDLWNHVTGEWTRAELSQPRKKPEAVSVGGKIIIAGGEVAKPPPSTQLSSAAAATAAGAAASLKGYTAVVDIFDSATGLWSTAEMLQARQYFGATAATDELAVFAGGFFNDVRLAIVEVYNASSSTWSVGQPLSANRSNLQAVTVAHRYAAFGSGNIDAAAKVTFDFFDGLTGEWAHSHGHEPGNPAMVSVGNLTLFAYPDGTIDTLALNSPCP